MNANTYVDFCSGFTFEARTNTFYSFNNTKTGLNSAACIIFEGDRVAEIR